MGKIRWYTLNDFSNLVLEGLQRIWEEDKQSQLNYLDIIAAARHTTPDLLRRVDAFFVPNDEYLKYYFSSDISDPSYDCYFDSGLCKWSNCLVIPIYNIANEVVAFGGFNPLLYAKSHEENGEHYNYYLYSDKTLFKKGDYIYCPKGIQEKALLDGYIFVTDGIFDTISLVGAGFNAASLMSSSLTSEIVVQLRMYDRVILVCDNDEAGLKLRTKALRMLPKATVFSQGRTKDIDELLNSEYRDDVIKSLMGAKNATFAISAKF